MADGVGKKSRNQEEWKEEDATHRKAEGMSELSTSHIDGIWM
jgi:hypothetical protein